MRMALQLLNSADLDEVLEVQLAAYAPVFQETREVFADRLRFHPAGCWVCRAGHAVAGYLISHPWDLNAPPQLNACIDPIAAVAACFYLHDLAVHPRFRGHGVGTALATKAIDLAADAGFDTLALTAVQSSNEFWERHGFVVVAASALTPSMGAQLASYGSEARYMVRCDTPRGG
jgi:GNAT superfamily N-acetyltransferase